MTSVNCAWPDCENTVVHGDKESMTEFGGMCPYHKAMIPCITVILPNQTPKNQPN